MRFAQVATRVWGCEMNFEHPEVTALEGINAFQSFLVSLGMPRNFEELGAKEEDIPKLVETLFKGNPTGKIDCFISMNAEDIMKIYKMML